MRLIPILDEAQDWNGMMRLRYGWFFRPHLQLIWRRSQNRFIRNGPSPSRDLRPYRHAEFVFALGPVSLHVYVHNNHGRGMLGGGHYWMIKHTGINAQWPSPLRIWRSTPYR